MLCLSAKQTKFLRTKSFLLFKNVVRQNTVFNHTNYKVVRQNTVFFVYVSLFVMQRTVFCLTTFTFFNSTLCFLML